MPSVHRFVLRELVTRERAETAPVSHQKRLERNATNAIESKRKCRKINEPARYPVAHNGLVAGSSPAGPTSIFNCLSTPPLRPRAGTRTSYFDEGHYRRLRLATRYLRAGDVTKARLPRIAESESAANRNVGLANIAEAMLHNLEKITPFPHHCRVQACSAAQ